MSRLATSGTRYQQGCPLRVMELSMMSSATRKNACSCKAHKAQSALRQGRRGHWAPRCTFIVMRCMGMQQQTCSPLQLCVRALHKYGQNLLVACKPAKGRLLKKQAYPLNAPAQNIGLEQLLTAGLQEAEYDTVTSIHMSALMLCVSSSEVCGIRGLYTSQQRCLRPLLGVAECPPLLGHGSACLLVHCSLASAKHRIHHGTI